MIRYMIGVETVRDDRRETNLIHRVTIQGTRDLREGRDGESFPGTSGQTLLGRRGTRSSKTHDDEASEP